MFKLSDISTNHLCMLSIFFFALLLLKMQSLSFCANREFVKLKKEEERILQLQLKADKEFLTYRRYERILSCAKKRGFILPPSNNNK